MHYNDDNFHHQNDHNKDNTGRRRQGSSTERKEKKKGDLSERYFDVILKYAKCLNSGDRFDELLKEFEGCILDVVLLCETWRQEHKEIWESLSGPIFLYMVPGGFTEKHGVGKLWFKKWKRKIIQTKDVSERMITTTIELTSVYFSRSGYADMHIDKM